MGNQRWVATVVGSLYLLAMVASLAGGVMIEGAIAGEGWRTAPPAAIVGVILEIINALAVLGIGALLLPVLEPHGPGWSHVYLALRIVEAVICILAATAVLALVSLAGSDGHDLAMLSTVGAALQSARAAMVGALVPLLMGLGGLVLYSLLLKSGLTPRYIAIWGLAGVVLMWLMNLIGTASPAAMVLVLPLILNEIYLGIYLIAKGFRA